MTEKSEKNEKIFTKMIINDKAEKNEEKNEKKNEKMTHLTACKDQNSILILHMKTTESVSIV